MTDPTKVTGGNWRIYLLCAAILVANCLWRVLVPAHEYGSSGSVWLSVLVDTGLVAGLIGLYRQFSQHMAPDDGRRGLMALAFWPALIAGVVIFAIRFSSSEGWWTGHLRYALD